MNFTKYQREKMYNSPLELFSGRGLVNQLIEDCNELEKELTASRDSRILSAVPSEEEIDIVFEEFCNFYESEDGSYSALESDDFRLAVKELFKQGIAG